MPLTFNGTTQWVDITAGGTNTVSICNNVGAITLSMWINATSTTPSLSDIYAYSTNSSATLSRAKLRLSTNTVALLGRAADGETTSTLTTTATINTGTWYHIVGVNNYAAGTQAIYINGALSISTSTTNFTQTTTTNLNSIAAGIGAEMDGSTHWFSGSVQDCRVYTRALSASEILTIYTTRGRDMIVDCKNRYMMSERSAGTTASGTSAIVDFSSAKYNGTQINGPVYSNGILVIQ